MPPKRRPADDPVEWLNRAKSNLRWAETLIAKNHDRGKTSNAIGLLDENSIIALTLEQPKKFEFISNLKAAKQIGLTIPPNVLVRVDKVIK
jgi:hypothetical protein